GEHPLGAFLRDAGTGVQEELESARAQIVLVGVGTASDVRQKAGEQRAMDRLVAGGVDLVGKRIGPAPAELGHLLGKLPVQVAPLAQAKIRHEMRTALLDELPVRQFRRQRVSEELPERKEAQEIRALVAKAQVRLVGGLALFQRTLARI